MAQAKFGDSILDAPLLELLREEKKKALSPREWKFRMAGFGYGIEDAGEDQIVTKLPHGTELGILPASYIQ
ncbi:hypothetical protein ACXYMO_13425 [Arenibacterium sp. CAU 1754]